MAASTTALSFDEYLKTSFPDLDCEFVDGEVRERAMPDPIHSRIQAILISLFQAKLKSHQWIVYPELRLLLRPGLVRIPDIAVYQAQRPSGVPPTNPPVIVIEILSESDRFLDVHQKFSEYRRWGVRHIWLVDPWLRVLHEYTESDLRAVEAFEVPGVLITLDQLLEEAES